jgi:hypothetical protein
MTSIAVASVLYYLTEVEGVTWRPDDYTTNKMIKAAKDENINGYFDVVLTDKTRRRFDNTNKNDFLSMLLAAMAQRVSKDYPGKYTLVPIPNSDATVANQGVSFRSLELASVFARHAGGNATVVPALRWRRERTASHRGGSRDPQVHFENLAVMQNVSGPVLLFDDVITTGSQLIGAYRRLAAPNREITKAVVIGRATKEQRERTFGWTVSDLIVDEPPLDFGMFRF